MAIPENYIDKITKDGQSRMISPAADMVRVNSEEYEGDNLGDVLDEIADAVADAASSADLSGLFAAAAYNSTTKEINFLDKNNTVVATIDAKPFVRDGMVSSVSLSNGVLTITFNTDAGKEPISVSLGDLFNADNYYTKTDADGKFVVQVNGKGLSSNDYTNADQAAVATIADKADKTTVPDIYQPRLNAGTGIAINGSQISVETASAPTSGTDADLPITAGGAKTALDLKQDLLQFDNEPTENSVKMVNSGGIYTALQSLLSNIGIGSNGNWFIGDVNNPNNDTGVKAQGPKGNSVVDGDTFDIVNNLTDGGEEDALSAEMGKWLYTNLYMIFTQLGTYAFPNGKPQIDWGGGNPPVIPPCTVSKTIGTGLSSTGGDSDVAFGDPLEVSIAITNNLYIVDDDSVEVTMGGSPVQGAWNASTMKVTIAAVTGNVVINVPSLTYVDDGYLVAMFDGMNRGGVQGEWSDVIDNTRKVILDQCTEQTDHVQFDGLQSTAIASSTDVGVNVGYDEGTIEGVFNGLEVNSTTIIGGVFNEHKYSPNGVFKRLLCMGITYSSAYGNACGVAHYQYNAGNDNAGNLPNAWLLGKSSVNINDAVYLSVSNLRAYLNGVALSRSTTKDYLAARDFGRMGISCFHKQDQSLWKTKGKYYCIRIYSKQLSEQEVQRNYKIDKKRFNL